MEPIDTSDAAIGWGLILALGLVLYFGTTWILRFVVREIQASREEQRLRRERAEEAHDDAFREELLAILAREEAEAEAAAGRIS